MLAYGPVCKPEPAVAACLKDLQRLLRQDTDTREAFQVLGQYNIAKSDLVPLIVTYPKDTDVIYNARKNPCVTSGISLAFMLLFGLLLNPAYANVDTCSAVKVLTYLTMPIDRANDSLPTQVRVAVPFTFYPCQYKINIGRQALMAKAKCTQLRRSVIQMLKTPSPQLEYMCSAKFGLSWGGQIRWEKNPALASDKECCTINFSKLRQFQY